MKIRDKILLSIIDFVLVLFAIYLAVVIRFEGKLSVRYFYGFEWLFIAVAIMCVGSYYAFGLYKKLWRYAGVQELQNIFFANVVAFTPVTLATLLTGGRYYSRSIIFIAALLTFFLTGGIRFLLRIVHERATISCDGKRVLIVGANDQGEAVLRELMRGRMGGYCPVGFVDQDPAKAGIRIHNVPILGSLEDIPDLTRDKEIEEIIIALPSPSLIQEVITLCQNIRVGFKVVPGLSDLIDGRVSVNKLRNVQIEDLLERDEVPIDTRSVKHFLEGRTILVTGAGGSIGSELCRQVVGHNIKKLILLGRGENSIYEITLELKNLTGIPLVQFIGDVRDPARMKALMEEHRPDVVFHTAAHKHVPMMESNISEAVANNVFGTRNLIRLAEEYQVESFTLLSTDKAVNPSSIMGATKRLSEMYMKSFSSSGERKCRFSAVRFGNVLDSRGSVVPTFRRQVAMGGPVTVTHPDMTRFFMTIPEAVHLVIQASALGRRGEIFILDMGRPVKIIDLARNVIRLSGFEPDRDIQIKILGVRPGEKLEEKLVNDRESTEPTENRKILRVITSNPELETMEAQLNKLRLGVESNSQEEIRELLKKIVPDYHPVN